MKRPSSFLLQLRYLRYLAWEFRWPVTIFAFLIFTGAFTFRVSCTGYDHLSYPALCYGVFCLIFLEAYLDFPEVWYLQPLFFLIPIIGLGAIADSVVRLGYLVISQRRNLQEWQQMVASLYRDHIVVVGVGKVGLRVIRGLQALEEAVVAVELETESEFLEEIHEVGIPIIAGDARTEKVLRNAGIDRARAVILATDSDLVNLDAALTAQDINPQIRVVLRLFDETLARRFAAAFHMPTVSIAHVSAPAFIAAATERRVFHSIEIEGHTLNVIDLKIRHGSLLEGTTIGTLQSDHDVNIMMHHGQPGPLVNPSQSVLLQGGDTLVVCAPHAQLAALEKLNRMNG